MFSRWKSVVARFVDKIQFAVPSSWVGYTITCPNDDAIRTNLLNNPERKTVSKLWTAGSAYHKHLTIAVEKLGCDVDLNLFGEVLTDAKSCVGAAAACTVIFDSGPKVKTESEHKDVSVRTYASLSSLSLTPCGMNHA